MQTAVFVEPGRVEWREVAAPKLQADCEAIVRPDCRHWRDGVLEAWAHSGFRPDLAPTHVVAWDDAPEAWASDALYVVAARF